MRPFYVNKASNIAYFSIYMQIPVTMLKYIYT